MKSSCCHVLICRTSYAPPIKSHVTESGVQFNRHLKFKAWVKALVKDEDKDAFRKGLDGEMVKAWVKAWVKAVTNVY